MIHALRYTEELEKVGFTTEQAKKSVQVWMELMDQNFATKADFKEHYFMSKTDLMELSVKFKDRCDDIETTLNKRCDDIESTLNKRCDDIETNLNKRCDSIEHKFEKLESRLTIKLGIMMAASIGIVSTIINFSK